MWAAAVAIFVLFLSIRLGLLTRHGLWVDEVFSIAMATGHSLEHPADNADPSLGDYVEHPGAVPSSIYAAYASHDDVVAPPAGPGRVVRAVSLSDTSPPGYYILLHYWTRALGTSDAALRAFSVFWAAACFPLMWSMARQLGGRFARVPTCLLYALAPLSVTYSTEGRMYSLVWFLAAAAMWLALRFNRRGASWWSLALWVAVGAAGALTHYFFVFVWLAAFAWLMLHPGRVSHASLVAAAGLIVALAVPWYLRIPESLSNWRVTGDWLRILPRKYSFPKALWRLVWSFVAVDTELWLRTGLVTKMHARVTTPLLFIAIMLAAAWRLRGRMFLSPRWQLMWLCAGGAVVGTLLFDLVMGTYAIAVPRYAIAGLPAALLLAGSAIGSLPRLPRLGFTALVVLFYAAGVRQIYMSPFRTYQPWRQHAQVIAREAGAGDVVIVHSIPSGVVTTARYIEEARERSPRGGPPVEMASWVGQLGRRRVPQDIEALTAARERVFFFRMHAIGEPSPELDWLDANAKRVSRRKIHESTDGELIVFVPRAGSRTFGSARPAGPTTTSPEGRAP